MRLRTGRRPTTAPSRRSAARPRVSILLVTYESERFLGYQLETLAQQTVWNDAELVIVANDPSRAERRQMQEFRRRWQDRVRLLVVPRETLYASLNRGIRAARASLLALANVDDIRTPTGLSEQVCGLEAARSSLFCYGPFTVVRKFRSHAGKTIVPPSFDRLQFTRSMLVGPFFVWRRRFHGATLYFDEQFQSGGDFDFAVRLACLGEGIRVDERLGFYYDGGSGLSTGTMLQPIERTVIELRYGIFDKIDYERLPDAIRYNLPNLLWNGAWHPVADCVPDYENWLLNRRRAWFATGRRRHAEVLPTKRGTSSRHGLVDLVKSMLNIHRGTRLGDGDSVSRVLSGNTGPSSAMLSGTVNKHDNARRL